MTEKEFDNPITVRSIIELLGKPKEHVSSTLKLIVNGIENKDNIIVVKKEFFEPEEHDGLFSAFTELEMKFKDLESVVAFCFENLPTSVEILEPAVLRTEARTLTNFFTDLLTKLHKLDEELKVEKQRDKILEDNMIKSLRNLVIITLSSTPDKTMGSEQLSRRVGIPEQQLLPLLEFWTGQNFLIKVDDKTFKLK